MPMPDETQAALPEALPESEPAAPPTAALSGIGPFHWLATTAIAIAVSGAALGIGWAYYQRHRSPEFASVNVQAVMAAREKVFADMVSKGQGNQAYDLASRTGPALAAALATLSKDCGCVLLVSQAVAGPNMPDLTSRLSQLMDGALAKPAASAPVAQAPTAGGHS